ncbi:MAG TPA: hypothetical protein VHC20_06610 [Candidatus Paceibacterota bacterium]|nr:hypothetical protein [Candidatus Paceibacterota bacterium]
MKRVLVIRLFTLELLPMIAALALSAYSQRFMPSAFAAAAIAIFTCVSLSLREGAVLAKWGFVCEKKKDRFGYWFYVGAHSFFGAFYLMAAAITFFRP